MASRNAAAWRRAVRPVAVRPVAARTAGVWPVLATSAWLVFAAPLASAAESEPLPVPAQTLRAQAVRSYNSGVELLLARQFAPAQARFEAALKIDESLAEAHNNLAFSLRMQGAQHFDRSLRHYNRAIELKPGLARAYMYRGVLFSQIGDLTRARADHVRLLTLDADLAASLEKAILGVERDERSGITGLYQ